MDSTLTVSVQAFSQIPAVAAIYHDDITLWVFTDNPVYDEALMSELLEVELSLNGLSQFIEYCPLVFGPPEMVVSPQAVCVYRRAG